MLQPNSPGVYVEEIPSLPRSVAQVPSDITAFVGLTALIPPSGTHNPFRINSLIDYETHFGRAKYLNNYHVVLGNDSGILKIKQLQHQPMAQRAILYYAMQLYFMNGGGPCYIVPIEEANNVNYISAIQALTSVEEVSILTLPDASLLLNAADYYEICNITLQHCGSITNRFAIIDVLDDDDGVMQFRNHVVTNLRDGAAYTPFLNTNYSFEYDEDKVQVSIEDAAPISMSVLAGTNPTYYQFLKTELASSQKVTLPPSAAVAGIYVRQDRDRGVWKAPANISIVGVTSLTRIISQDEQDHLNVDTVSGKSINAIRSFPGRGIKVWGARTLAGNDYEYRYISVRRFINVVEASVEKASHFVVFEDNDGSTWNRVKLMIENYLQTLWRAGGLQGSTPEKAYYVRVGLGRTMSAQDILDGRVIIEIGLAVIKPAEFIIIRIRHNTDTSLQTNTNIMTAQTETSALMQTTLEWDDLVLEPKTKAQLKEVSNWIAYNKTLLNDWGMAGKVRQSFSVLFHGPSGTGKSLSATLIGKTAKRPVYRVDLSHIISKYIGETEKNLNRVFQQATLNDSILYFDEADALFGKRTQVDDAHDRYANQEVSYLLQRIKKYSGLVIFSTKNKNHIDDVLIRQLDMLVEFPKPDKEARLQLWKQSIPTKATLASEINLKSLAEDYELNGSTIMNVIYYACLQALKRRTNTIELSDILKGIKKELSRKEAG